MRTSVFAGGRDLMPVDSATKAMNDDILELNIIIIDAPSICGPCRDPVSSRCVGELWAIILLKQTCTHSRGAERVLLRITHAAFRTLF